MLRRQNQGVNVLIQGRAWTDFKMALKHRVIFHSFVSGFTNLTQYFGETSHG